jgi:class 3 adenylate cyclase
VRTVSADLGLPAHGGVHAGRVIERDPDLFGSTVNLASRVSSAAGPGEVLVTEAVTRLANLEPGKLEEVGSIPLKGVLERRDDSDRVRGRGDVHGYIQRRRRQHGGGLEAG